MLDTIFRKNRICGLDDGKYDLVGSSTIIGPDGKLVTESKTEEDKVIVADCDLDLCLPGKTRTFDFARHRQTEHYAILTSHPGVIQPPRLSTRIPTRSSDGRMLDDSQNRKLQLVTRPTGA